MKVLAFSDIHSDLHAARNVVHQSKSVDVVICAGDLCNGHQQLQQVVTVLQYITKPIILVAGNNETTEALRDACVGWASAIVLHGKGLDVLGIPFYGIGGGIPVTPFGEWSYDFPENEAERMLADCPSDGVIVSHSPPFGILDVSSSGRHLGSTAIYAAMERCRPKLLVCGHIHASQGQTQRAGDTLVVNAGPNGVIVEL